MSNTSRTQGMPSDSIREHCEELGRALEAWAIVRDGEVVDVCLTPRVALGQAERLGGRVVRLTAASDAAEERGA